MENEKELREQLADISNTQKETNERLTMLLDKLVGDPLSKRKGWVTIIEENSEDILHNKQDIASNLKRIESIDSRLQKLSEKKSKVGATLLGSLGSGGVGAITGANWSSIKKFILSILNGL